MATMLRKILILSILSVVMGIMPLKTLAMEISNCVTMVGMQQGEFLRSMLHEDHPYFTLTALRKKLHISLSDYLRLHYDKTLGEILEMERRRQEMYILELNEIQNSKYSSQEFKSAIAGTINIARKINFPWTQNIESMHSYKIHEITTLLPTAVDKLIKRGLSSQIGVLKGAMAEVEVASLTSGLQQSPAISTEILSISIIKKLRNLKKKIGWKQELNSLLNFEMDIVFNNGGDWAEVKSRKFTAGKQKKKVIVRAKKIATLIKHLKSIGINIQMHYFFVGVIQSDSLIVTLQDLGFKVHTLP